MYRFLTMHLSCIPLLFLLSVLIIANYCAYLLHYTGFLFYLSDIKRVVCQVWQQNHFFFFIAILFGFFPWIFYVRYWFGYGSWSTLGNARWAKGIDLYRAGFFVSRGLCLGHHFYGVLRYDQFEPILFVAGTGGGKTKAFVIPNLLELVHESVLVTDIKGEIFSATATFRMRLGPVKMFNPAHRETACYNPFSLVRRNVLHEDLDIIFKILIPDSKEALWSTGSRNIMKTLTLIEIEQGVVPTLSLLYKRLCNPKLRDQLANFYEQKEDMSDVLRNLCGKCLSVRLSQFKDLCLQAQEFLSCFDQPNLAYATSKNDFNFKQLREKVTTFYVQMPPHTETYGPICALFLAQLFQHNCEEDRPDVCQRPINCFIDEFANLPQIPSITKGINFFRSYRIRVCCFIQHTGQLSSVYGKYHRENFLAMPTKIIFNVTSREDARYFSEICGTRTVQIRSGSSRGLFKVDWRFHTQSEPLIRPDDLQRLSKKKFVIIKTGFFPVIATKNFWFKSKKYSRHVQ